VNNLFEKTEALDLGAIRASERLFGNLGIIDMKRLLINENMFSNLNSFVVKQAQINKGILDIICLSTFKPPIINQDFFNSLNSVTLKPPLINENIFNAMNVITKSTPINNGFLDAINSFTTKLGTIVTKSAHFSVSLSNAVNYFATGLTVNNEKWLNGIDAIAKRLANAGESMSAFSSYLDTINFDDDAEYLTFDELSEDDINELNDALHSIATSTNDFDIACEEQNVAINKRKPMLAKALKYIVLNLIIPFLFVQLGTYTWNRFIVQKDALVREEPNSISTVINNITINQHFFIVDSVPYYYHIKFQDPKTNELVEGYLYKNNAKPAELTDEMIESYEKYYKNIERIYREK